MTEPIDPLRSPRVVPADDRRRGDGDRRGAADTEEGAECPPAVIVAPCDPAPPPEIRPSGASEVFAQLLGQGQRRRGLRGGRPVLDAARSTYLETEYSGPDDRRPKPGKVDREV